MRFRQLQLRSNYIARSKTWLLIWLVLLAQFVSAQEVIPLYEGIPPGNLNKGDNESFSRSQNGRPSVINVTHPALIAYIPEHPSVLHTAVIICPGGGYVRLTIEDGGYDVAKELASAGIAAFVLKYRTWQDSAYSDYRNLPLDDYKQALKIITANAEKWSIDKSRIGVMGFSAGGHLATMAAVNDKIARPAFTILGYPVISFTDSLVSRTLRSRSTLLGKNISDDDKEAFSPELHVTSSTPPAFIVHAEDDSTSLVGNSLAYYKALVRNKVAAQLLLFQKGGHGFAIYNKAQEEHWLPAALKWLELNGFYKAKSNDNSAAVPPYWQEIIAFKKKDFAQKVPARSILFVGSSSFTKWTDVNNYFPGYPIINRGFGGSTLIDVMRYAYDVILPYKPKQVLIYCGENDLASSDSISGEEVVNRYKTLFSIIRTNLPATRISFISIKPSPVRASIQKKVKEANKTIKEFTRQQKNADFIDIYNAMLDGQGMMREELYLEDRLHIRPEGYAIWKKNILPYLIK